MVRNAEQCGSTNGELFCSIYDKWGILNHRGDIPRCDVLKA